MTYSNLHELLSIAPSEWSQSSDHVKLLLETQESNPSVTTSNVRNLTQYTIPDGKLFYPEPFIASPSYLHSDLTYLHIFQYWYWLWFMFIFLICFFFISFVCTVRWCNNRVRPRRETRGVSRSKCGDLITACVPVSWAISIIVNESTDATDLNDGFGTAELVVGVRAYQWGWEYYYPRTIDLNYNVKPSYSSFVGNSLKYNFSSGKSMGSNMLWRMYQNKAEDAVVTPAHLLLSPSDSNNSLNLLNFKNIGLNTLSESSAFPKIRNASKAYNSHLVHTPSSLSAKYKTISNLYANENDHTQTSSFGLKRQHNLASTSALGNSFSSTVLDNASFQKFISSNLNLTSDVQAQYNQPRISPLSLTRDNVTTASTEASRIAALSAADVRPSASSEALASYPTLLTHINDNSDKSGLSYPIFKLTSPALSSGELLNKEIVYSNNNSTDTLAATQTYPNLTTANVSTSSKYFNLSGPNSKVLLGEQSIRNLPTLTPNKSNLNLSSSGNTITSNFSENARLNTPLTPANSATDFSTNYVDRSIANKLGSARSFLSSSYPAVLSSSALSTNSLEYDSPVSISSSLDTTGGTAIVDTTKVKSGSTGDVFVGSREKTPRAINTAYWSTFWASTNPSSRVLNALRANADRTLFYLPAFTNYSDYDFRNDQAIDMLEELFWETSYSSYNFYDYMTLNKNISSANTPGAKDFGLEKQFYASTLGLDLASKSLSTSITKDKSLVGEYYGNSIQLEEYPLAPSLVSTDSYSVFPFYNELAEMDESFANFKAAPLLFSKVTTAALGVSSSGLTPRSYISVFNHFRSDYEDFTWARESGSAVSSLEMTDADTIATLNAALAEDSQGNFSGGFSSGSDIRLSNPATLRSSVRNSIVNYNAFQKVFKPRLDEGRAHIQSSNYADLGLKQPFLSDSKVPYTSLLAKNTDSFYETPLYKSAVRANWNSTAALGESLNSPMYDFPFLLARTSDTTRFTWIDWFAKWKHIEVQPSSVSRYSTLGVPYQRKPFDFNSTTGDKFQDTETYFTRVARSRRNYLTNWSYSPYIYNRTYLWNALTAFKAEFLNPSDSLDSSKSLMSSMGWYWTSVTYQPENMHNVNYSSSGNDVYGKATWRPRTSIQGYYYGVSKLIDILSKREQMYRAYLETSRGVVHVPSSFCATPNNPLLRELKASFLFIDPSNYSSEHSRDLFYTLNTYFKFLYLQTLAQSVSDFASSLPINTKLLTNYVFFYFFDANKQELGNTAELYKNQFRPLKKGISSMLRFHATGAIAMPIEIRLQILASSRDVIHSWAVPSALVKIDCVPGYTSHRMMKFLLTGVYWGQCQEICGRYHHWMPIVVYFMKRDLFFLWCTHFVFTANPNENWEIGDRKFADFIRFASYDKSSWVNEFAQN